MKKCLLFILSALSFQLPAETSDPFKKVLHSKLSNGLHIVLAPNPRIDLIQVKVNVGVGFAHERKANYGVSHLLEHVLFRDKKLKDDMSYLQLIKEKEGSANGTTSWDRTSYYATVKKKDGPWLIDTFHTMLMRPSLDARHVETEKKTVLLEIGEPSFILKTLGFDLWGLFTPKYLRPESYWEREFGVHLAGDYSAAEEQLATLRLTQEQLRDHYREFYDPSNMQILISGSFDPQMVLTQIKSLWESHPSDGKGDRRPHYLPSLKNRPYNSHRIDSGTPNIQLGYQVVGVSFRDKEVLRSYTEYLAHRLMKKIRNLNGETYTVSDRSDIRQDFGSISIGFESSRGMYAANYDLVSRMMEEEMVLGKLSGEDIEEAKRLHLNAYALWGESAGGLGRMADKMFYSNEPHGTWKTPHDLLTGTSDAEYLAILKKYANPEHRFVNLHRPEIFFQYDYLLLWALSCLTFFLGFKTLLKKPFKHDGVRWVRKVSYPPLKSLELSVGLITLFIGGHVFFLMNKYLFDFPSYKALGIVAQYLDIVITTLTLTGLVQAVISLVPRKLYFMEGKLVIKSLSYFSKHIPQDQVRSISCESPLRLMLNPPRVLRMWNSFFYFDPRFWREGLVIELLDGKEYFFGTRDAQEASEELNRLLLMKKEPFLDGKMAA